MRSLLATPGLLLLAIAGDSAHPLSAQGSSAPAVGSHTISAQAGSAKTDQAADLVVRLAAMTAITGYEQAMADTLLALLPGSRRDRAGNAVLVLGSGEPRRLAACPLDETGFAVGRVRPDGWITLRRSPASRRALPGPLFDQQLEGQRVTVFGRRGPVPGVIAVRSVHLTRGREPPAEAPFTVDDAYLDVGAASSAEVSALGLGVLAPVALTKRPLRYGGDKLAAPWAGRRAACAALLQAARQAVEQPGSLARGSTVVAFVVEQQLSSRGLLTMATTRGPFAETGVADGATGARALLAADSAERSAGGATPRGALGRVHAWPISTTYPGTPVETVSLGEVERTSQTIGAWLRGEGGQ